MSPEVRELIDQKPFYREGLRQIAALLPADDSELHRWLKDAIERSAADDFTFLIFAAAISGRKLSAELLRGGATLMPDDWRFAWIAWRMEGDLATALLDAAEAEAIPMSRRAVALFVVVQWLKEHKPQEELPSRVLLLARYVSTQKCSVETFQYLAAVGFSMCAQILTQSERKKTGVSDTRQKALVEQMLTRIRGSFEALIPEQPTTGFIGSGTHRRAVERVGRNEKCPCGSGRKYKQCCSDEDQERLSLSQATDIAGRTVAEVEKDLTAHLTEARLNRMQPAEIVKLDAARVPTNLQENYLLRLCVFNHLEKLADGFEKIGVPEHLRLTWNHAVGTAIQHWRKDILVRLLNVWPEAESILGGRGSGVPLLLSADDPHLFLETLEAEALRALKERDGINVQELAGALMCSPHRALAILIARGALPLVDSKLATELFEDILMTRGRLNLPAEDDFNDWMNDRALRRAQKQETAAIQEAHDKLAAKMKESRADKEELARLKRELSLRDRKERREQAEVAPMPDAEAAEERRRLKAKIASAKAREVERGEEVLALRRELDKALQALDATTPGAEKAEPEGDDSFIEVDGNQPVRLIDFPQDFGDTLTAVPRHVGRAVMNRIGRLASGEPAAFDRIKQLKAYPSVLRARVSDKYRLLFCLEPDRVRIVDLIRRADLDRRIERLQASGLPRVA